ncbi:hypothetical protein BHM03_00039171 [Ensete ventricosum]|nr:hypothetical protein BHM03_00039171 [Ensete ventricosum]
MRSLQSLLSKPQEEVLATRYEETKNQQRFANYREYPGVVQRQPAILWISGKVSLSLNPIYNISQQLTEAMEGQILHDFAGKTSMNSLLVFPFRPVLEFHVVAPSSAVTSGILGSQLSHSKASPIEERYVLARELGRGDFGVTYLCIDRNTRELFACKSISKRKLRTAVDVEDVRREVAIMRHSG